MSNKGQLYKTRSLNVRCVMSMFQFDLPLSMV